MPKLTIAAVRKYTAQSKRREIPDAIARAASGDPATAQRHSVVGFALSPAGWPPAKLTLGRVDLGDSETSDAPVIGGALTLRQARELANRIDRQRARGLDVVEEHQTKRRRQRDVAQDRATNTFGSWAREFFGSYKTKHKQRPRRWREDAALLGLQYPTDADPATFEPEVTKGGLADSWRDKPVATIDGHDIHRAVDQARKLGADSRARKLSRIVRHVPRLLQQRRVTSNPAHGVWRPGLPADRERVLTDAEIVTFWKACDQLGPRYDALFKLPLLTGCRLREAARMTRGELVNGVWTVPAGRTKNHRSLSLPLPPLALQIIARVPVIESAAGFVFTADGKRPVSGFSQMKQTLDAAMAEIAGHPVPEFDCTICAEHSLLVWPRSRFSCR